LPCCGDSWTEAVGAGPLEGLPAVALQSYGALAAGALVVRLYRRLWRKNFAQSKITMMESAEAMKIRSSGRKPFPEELRSRMCLSVFANMIRIHLFPSLRHRVVPNFLDSGWQRSSRFVPSHTPRSTPNRSIASYAYIEQVGSNRSFPANNTERYACSSAGRKGSADGYALSSRRKSAANASNDAFATELFGWMTMSHPRVTPPGAARNLTQAPPDSIAHNRATKSFLMLKPKRLCGRLFAFTKAVKWELERRFPARYTGQTAPSAQPRFARILLPGFTRA